MSEMNDKNLDLLWDVNVNVYVRLGSWIRSAIERKSRRFSRHIC